MIDKVVELHLGTAAPDCGEAANETAEALRRRAKPRQS
jgi:hypothetical protein